MRTALDVLAVEGPPFGHMHEADRCSLANL